MQVRYKFQVKSRIRLTQAFEIRLDPASYEFELGEHGALTYITATVKDIDKAMWPSTQPSTTPGIDLHINPSSPHLEEIRAHLRTAEGMLSMFGMEAIDTENVEESWHPETDEERRELTFYGIKKHKPKRDIKDIEPLSFDLVARALLSAPEGSKIETALSFYRKGTIDVLEQRYLEAVMDFLFMIESLYANGKFRAAQVETEYLNSPELLNSLKSTLADPYLQQYFSSNSADAEKYKNDYLSRAPEALTRHLVDLRGFLHHHSKERKDIWHPEGHGRFFVDALFLNRVCHDIAFKIMKPVLFAPQHEAAYKAAFYEAQKRKQRAGPPNTASRT